METKKNETQIQKAEPVSPLAHAAELVQAANGKMDVEKLGQLLAMQERWEATQAKKAYVEDMAAFKADPPEILKDKTVSYGQTKYKHATLSNVTACLNKALSEHNLTTSWVTSQDNNLIKVTCKITHTMGHSEETCLSAAPDTSGSKNPIQAIGSTVTYLERYTLLALTGLATYEQDDDGKGAGDKSAIPKPTEQESKVLDQICSLLCDSVPDGKVLCDSRIDSVIYAMCGKYPNDINTAGTVAAWLINKGAMDKLTKDVPKEPGEPNPDYDPNYVPPADDIPY